jgi:cell division septation protein DedD
MERPRRRSRAAGPGGWLTTLGGGLLLVVVGFGVGLVAGAAFEDPALLMEHVLGRTAEVELPAAGPLPRPADFGDEVFDPEAGEEMAAAPAAPPAEEPAPAEPPARPPLGARRGAGDAPVAAAATEARAPAPDRPAAEPPAPAVAAPPPARAAAAKPARPAAPPAPTPARGGFAVQVGAFADQSGARKLVDDLRGHGYQAGFVREAGGRAPFKVRVGPVATREEAERLARKLKAEHHLPTWVLAQDAG